LDDILGSLMGGQAQAGSQAPAGGGLGDILGALLGGSSADAPNAPAAEPAPEEQPPIRTHRKRR
jgi:hypothetical protein